MRSRALQALPEPAEHYKAQPSAGLQRVENDLNTSQQNSLSEMKRPPGGGPKHSVSGPIMWFAEAEAQIARQNAFEASISNGDKQIALQACLAFSRTLCCISQEIMRESRDRIARISRDLG